MFSLKHIIILCLIYAPNLANFSFDKYGLILIIFGKHHEHTFKKALRETQTLRAGCSKAEPKIFAPPQTRGTGRPKFNQLEMVIGTFTYKPNLVRIDVRNFELSW